MVLTVQSLHWTSCVCKSCVPISLLSLQKTPGHPSPAGELLLSQCLPCSLPGNPAAPMGGSSSVTHLSGADLVWFASQVAVCVLVHGGIPWGPFGCRFVARVSSQWLHSRCPGRALGYRHHYQLMPEPCPGARLQLQTNSAQPHCSHRPWHPPQSPGVCAVTNPARLSSHAGGPSAEHPMFQQRGDVFPLGCRGDFSF